MRIEKDPDMNKLAQEARRLSMGGTRKSPEDTKKSVIPRSSGLVRNNAGQIPRRPSEAVGSHSPRLSDHRRQSDSHSSDGRRGSDFHNELVRKASSELDSAELEKRRLSEAGLRRPSASEVVLNEDTSSLMVGQQVWVDGNKYGRIAYLGEVHFSKGEMAGIHLERPIGKNNGTVGGVMYFQCEPKHGIFSRLHRLTREPLISEDEEFEE